MVLLSPKNSKDIRVTVSKMESTVIYSPTVPFFLSSTVQFSEFVPYSAIVI